MADKILDSFDVWIGAQGWKSKLRLKSIDNISLQGIVRLRELILDLAVRGKLTPQISSEESAITLLNKILGERKKLIDDGLIREQKLSEEISEDAKPFTLPNCWCWARLGSIGIGSTGKTPSTNISSFFGGEIPFIGPGQISNQGEILESDKSLTEEGSGYSTIANKGDILMVCIGGSIGKTAIVKSKLTFNQQINCIRPILIDSSYLNFVMNSSRFQFELLEKSTGSATPIINRGKWEELLVSIPPLSEQHRIVAKVDELMALCDELEQQETNHLKSHQLLVETLLGTLTQAKDAAEFQTAWATLAQHFDDLFITEDSIDQLKQTILQLAVMGKLVKQDPKDASSIGLLEEIKKEKEKLVSGGKIKREKPLPEIESTEQPFSLPNGWAWERLVNLCEVITKGSSPKWQGISYTEDESDVLFITSENVGSYKLLLNEKKFVETKFNEIEPRSILRKGDFLMNIVGGSIGRTASYDIDDVANINQAVCLIRAIPGFMDDSFLLHFFNSEVCISYMFDKQVDNARANLSMGNISKFVIPIPPIVEQHRIVAKIEELFSLCDSLKEKIVESQAIKNDLANAVLCMV